MNLYLFSKCYLLDITHTYLLKLNAILISAEIAVSVVLHIMCYSDWGTATQKINT